MCLGTCALSLGVATPVRATVIAPADFPDVVNGSQLIVHGRVVDVRSQMTAGRRSIHSFVTVAVDQALKGSPGPTVTFRVPQGQVGRYRRIIVGAPEFCGRGRGRRVPDRQGTGDADRVRPEPGRAATYAETPRAAAWRSTRTGARCVQSWSGRDEGRSSPR